MTIERRWIWPAAFAAVGLALIVYLTLPREASGGGAVDPLVVGAIPLTDLPGLQTSPGLSPDGTSVVYSSETDSPVQSDIFLQRIGEQPLNLTSDDPEGNAQPAFDPKGERIAFTSGGDGGGIFVMGASGESRRFVTRGVSPSWSPDGTKLVYSTVEYLGDPYQRFDAIGQLWVVDLATNETSVLFDDLFLDALEPSWSPNDKRVAFWGRMGGQRDIWTVPVSAGDGQMVTDDAHTDWGPFWSPDGGHLYFLSDRGGKPELWRVSLNEDSGEVLGSPELVWGPTEGRVMSASIASDGRSIASTLERITSEIARVSLDPETAQLTGDWQTIYASSNDDLANLSVSPDGLWLAVTSRRGVEDVFVMRTDGSRRQNLTNDLAKDRNPTWYPVLDPDGDSWLTFSSNRDGPEYHVWAIRPNGTGLRQLLEEGTIGLAPRWWPDGRRLSISTTERVLFDFPDGILGESYGPGRGNPVVNANASWSPNGERIAQVLAVSGVVGAGQLTITSMDRRFHQVVVDPEGRFVLAGIQVGNRWIDDRRLVFWDVWQRKAFVWDTESQEATEIEGAGQQTGTSAYEFVVSLDGQTLFRQITTIDTDIWLLELSR